MDLITCPVEKASVDKGDAVAGGANTFLEIYRGAAFFVHDANLERAGIDAQRLCRVFRNPGNRPLRRNFDAGACRRAQLVDPGQQRDRHFGATWAGLRLDLPALVGSSLDEAAVAEAARLAREAADPVEDLRGPADFKRHAAGVMVQRAVARARDRASA